MLVVVEMVDLEVELVAIIHLKLVVQEGIRGVAQAVILNQAEEVVPTILVQIRITKQE